MITAKFYKEGYHIIGVSISGHAYYDDPGRDIVCASVTSALQLTANGITEILKVDAQVEVSDDEIKLMLPPPYFNREAESFLRAFALHIKLLMEDYSNEIKQTYIEV